MKKYILLLAAAGLMSSCYDLDQFPHDKISSATFWKTEDQAHQGMMSVYAAMKPEQAFGTYFGVDAMGDTGFGRYENVSKGTYTNSDGDIKSKWAALYEGVARANLLLQNIDQVDMTDALKAQYKGEAKFMRALYYFSLTDFWGGVPLYDEETVVGNDFMNMKKTRSSLEECHAFILKDLEEAINVLPVKWEQSEYGRATRGAAVALKGKVLLFGKKYSEAASAFEEIVNDPSGRGYNYSLYESYTDLFKPAGHASDEMIFAVQNSAGVGNDNGLPSGLYMGSRSHFGGGWNSFTPTDNLVDMYERPDGKPFDWEEYIPGYNALGDRKAQEQARAEFKKNNFGATLENNVVSAYPEKLDMIREIYENRDPRLEWSILTPYATTLGANGRTPREMQLVMAKGTNENYGYIRNNRGWYDCIWRKFVPEGDMDGLLNDRYHVPINFPIIRYADVLLMLAECYNENGKLNEAVELINQVRARSNMPGLNNGNAWMEARTKEEVFQRIVHERAVEFAAEGLRYSDLKRWKLCIEKLNFTFYDYLGNARYNNVFVERDYLWPIPLQELERNPDLKAQQNPGW